MADNPANGKKKWPNLSIKERIKYMIEQKSQEDCVFVVGKAEEKTKVIKFHKWILKCSSPVFERMFEGSFQEAHAPIPTIRLDDFEPEVFEAFIDFVIYQHLKQNVQLVIDLFYFGDKYQMDKLQEECISKLSELCVYQHKWLTAQELLLIWAWLEVNARLEQRTHPDGSESYQYVFYDLKSEHDFTYAYIEFENNISVILQCEDLYNFTPELFVKFMKRINNNTKKLSEYERFKVYEKYLKKRNIEKILQPHVAADEPSELLCENLLGLYELFLNFKFRSMTAKEFADGPGKSTLLSLNEKYEILTAIVSKDSAIVSTGCCYGYRVL